jgi:hypothetical protein
MEDTGGGGAIGEKMSEKLCLICPNTVSFSYSVKFPLFEMLKCAIGIISDRPRSKRTIPKNSYNIEFFN